MWIGLGTNAMRLARKALRQARKNKIDVYDHMAQFIAENDKLRKDIAEVLIMQLREDENLVRRMRAEKAESRFPGAVWSEEQWREGRHYPGQWVEASVRDRFL